MYLQVPICFSQLRFFLSNLCSKHFILLTESYCLIKEKFIDLVFYWIICKTIWRCHFQAAELLSYKLFDCKIWIVSVGIGFEAETHVCCLKNSVISVYISIKNQITLMVVFYPGFHCPSNCIYFHKSKDSTEGEGHFLNSWLPLPPASQTLRHYSGDFCRKLTSAHS